MINLFSNISTNWSLVDTPQSLINSLLMVTQASLKPRNCLLRESPLRDSLNAVATDEGEQCSGKRENVGENSCGRDCRQPSSEQLAVFEKGVSPSSAQYLGNEWGSGLVNTIPTRLRDMSDRRVRALEGEDNLCSFTCSALGGPSTMSGKLTVASCLTGEIPDNVEPSRTALLFLGVVI